MARSALDGITDTEARADLATSFDGLSDGVQAAILGELSMPEPGYVKEATAEQVELFTETEEGETLVEEWGGYDSRRTAHNVGIVRAKMRAAVERMSEADRQEFETWYDNLSEAEARSAIAALVT